MKFRIQCAIAWLFVFAGAGTASALMTDSNLFAALNLNYPGLDLVRTNVAQANYTAAKTNLAAYLRARTNVTWFFDPHAVTNTVSYSQILRRPDHQRLHQQHRHRLHVPRRGHRLVLQRHQGYELQLRR